MKQRIWELDALRGLCVIGMVLVHLIFDLVELYRIVDWQYPQAFLAVKNWGGVIFLLISGICVTLGSRCIRRGILVFASGMLCTLVTWGMYRFGFAGRGIVIYFGVLHCLGICMLLWPVFRKLPWWGLVLAGAGMIGLGSWVDTLRASTLWLMPLGILPRGFASSDYFPLIFNLGFFLLGAALGKNLYQNRQTLLPKVDADSPVIRFLRRCGSWSLPIYLLHQPVLAGVCMMIAYFRG